MVTLDYKNSEKKIEILPKTVYNIYGARHIYKKIQPVNGHKYKNVWLQPLAGFLWSHKMGKICSKCKIEKDINCFGKNKNSKDGLRYQCKKCEKESRIKYKTKDIEYHKQYYKKNQIYIKEYQTKNSERISQNKKTYYQKNKNKILQQRKIYYNKNKKYILKRQYKHVMKKLSNNEEFKLSEYLRSRLRKAIKNNTKTGSAIRDLGCSIPELKIWLENQFQPGMTWENWGNGEECWNIDHIIPAKWLDFTQYSHQRLFCCYLNLRPMWAIDNIQRDYADILQNKQVTQLVWYL